MIIVKVKFVALAFMLLVSPFAFATAIDQNEWSVDSDYYSFADGKMICQPTQMSFASYIGPKFNLLDGNSMSFTFEVNNDVLNGVTNMFNNIANSVLYTKNPIAYFFNPTTSVFSIALNNDTTFIPALALDTSVGSSINTVTTDIFVSGTEVFTKVKVNDVSLIGNGVDTFKLADVSAIQDTPPTFQFNTTEGPMTLTSFSVNSTAGGGEIPEPSSYALIFGALALGFAIYKRKR